MILSSHPGQPALSTISGPSVVATPDQLFIIALLKTMTKTKTKTKKHNEKDKDKKTMKIQDYEQLPHLISCLSLPLTIAVGQKFEIVENEENLNFVISLSNKKFQMNSTHSI